MPVVRGVLWFQAEVRYTYNLEQYHRPEDCETARRADALLAGNVRSRGPIAREGAGRRRDRGPTARAGFFRACARPKTGRDISDSVKAERRVRAPYSSSTAAPPASLRGARETLPPEELPARDALAIRSAIASALAGEPAVLAVSPPSFRFVGSLRGTGRAAGRWGASAPPCARAPGRSSHGRRGIFQPPPWERRLWDPSKMMARPERPCAPPSPTANAGGFGVTVRGQQRKLDAGG